MSTDNFHKTLLLVEEIKDKIKENEYKLIVESLMNNQKEHKLLIDKNNKQFMVIRNVNRRYQKLQQYFCRLSIEHYRLNQFCKNCIKIHENEENMSSSSSSDNEDL